MAWKTAQFMEQHLGEEYDALIISVQKFGFFVELMEIFVEGIVPITRIEELTGEQVFLSRARPRNRQRQRRRPTQRFAQREREAEIRPRRPGFIPIRSGRARLETRRPHPRPRRAHRPASPPRRVFSFTLSGSQRLPRRTDPKFWPWR